MATLEEAITNVTNRIKLIRSQYDGAMNGLETGKTKTLQNIETNTKNLLRSRVNWNSMGFTPNFNEPVSMIFDNLRQKGLINQPVIKTVEITFDKQVKDLNVKYRSQRENVEGQSRKTIEYLEKQLDKLQAKLQHV